MNHSMAQISVLNCEYHKLKTELEKKDTTIANLKLIQNDNLHALKFNQNEKRSEALKMQEVQFEL